MHIPSRITNRDRDLLHALYNHRVLTTDHIKDLFFQNETTARHRLTTLYKLQLVDRFQPLVAKGSAPFHYVLGHAGYLTVIADANPDYEKRHRWSQALAIGRSMHLRHKVGINTFFCQLALEARRNPNVELVEWKSERQLRDNYGAKPDGLGVWREGTQTARFYLEFDRGTETLERLGRKLRDYEETARYIRQSPFVVLFYFLTNRREANARRLLAEVGSWIPIATASEQHGSSPHKAIWLPLNEATERQRLATCHKTQ
jgi:predicted transcriptional regulator